MAQTATQQNTPVPLRTGTVRRFPQSERGRKARHTRLARQRWLLPPTDGSVSEWRSWSAEVLRCEMCQQGSLPRVHVLLSMGGYYGSYTLWRECTNCQHLHEEMAVPRQKIIDLGQRLGGWTPVSDADSLLARRARLDELRTHQRRRAMTANYGRGGGDRGA